MPRVLVNSALFEPIGPYSHVVKAGRQIFVSGTPGVVPATGLLAGRAAYEQSKQAFLNVKACIEAAGASEADVTHVQVHLVDVNDFAEMNRAYAEVFTKPYPARTVIGIAALPKQGALLTVNAQAVVE